MTMTQAVTRGLLTRAVGCDEGQDLLEYALLVALIALAAAGAVTTLGQTIGTTFWDYIAAAV
jgi:Flp pilus assembly pilin Flp